MKVLFQQAKNGQLTAILNNIYLHSSYNPMREAQRYVENINVSYSPSLILVLEPGLSYIIPLLRKRFPDSKIGIIRYLQDFQNFNYDADYIFNYFEHKSDFENFLFNTLGEEKIFGALVLQWQPSSKIFPEIENNILISIKNSMEKAKTLLVTREFFEKKWFLNSCNFVKYVNSTVSIRKKIDIPIVIISSGPSLKESLNIIKNNREKIFIICLSSAIKVCLYNNITPDLCVSTDGGFWAGEHLKCLTDKNIPLALPLEGFCQKNILEKNKILPLIYSDGISKYIADISNIPVLEAERNGTVSGTALILAMSISSNDIYFCGLDMSSQNGFQHCQPNEIELNNSIKDTRINSKEKRISISQYSKGVLSIYKEWFDFLNLNGRKVYRVIEKKYKNNTLGFIKDLSTNDFSYNLSNLNAFNNNDYFTDVIWKKNLKQISVYLLENLKKGKWIKNIFPLSMTSLSHNKNNTDIKNRLENDFHSLLKKTENILNEH